MQANRERLDLYFPTYLEDAEQLKGTIIDASERYLPKVVGGNVNQEKIHYLNDNDLSHRQDVKSLMVPALRGIREEMAKTRIFRITSNHEGGLSYARSKLEANLSKVRGRKRRPVWGKEGAVDFIAEEMPITELVFASAALQRAVASRPSEKKKLVLKPDHESLEAIRDVQQTILKGIRPALRRGVEAHEQIYENPVCEIADIDTRQSKDVHLQQFLDEVTACLPIQLPVDERITISFNS